MAPARSDALVVFGVTGDLAHKQIFPALYAMVKRGELTMPVIGVAFPKWSLERLQGGMRRRASRHRGASDSERALKELLSRLQYVSGDYQRSGDVCRDQAGAGQGRSGRRIIWRFRHRCFATVIENLGKSGLAKDARVIVEKPFGRDLACARRS